MFLTDYHIHSRASFDSEVGMAEMAAAARARGVSALCFTDHCDFGQPESMQLDGGPLPQALLDDLAEARRAAPERFYIGLGLELGQANHEPERAARVYARPELDFVLGSLHMLRGLEDFYFLKYESEEQCRLLYESYLDELIELAYLPSFDVMAHIGYCQRYMSHAGFPLSLEPGVFGDRLDLLLRLIIDSGRGIELNCADLLPGGRDKALCTSIPTIPVMRRYRELGGEIVTVGSDAHNTRAAGFAVKEGYELLAQLGFKYVAMYRKHVPDFIKIV